MEIEYERLGRPGNRLGSGEFGRVFESVYNNEAVVYKIMKHAVHSSIFYNEIDIMKRLSHPNVPRLIGHSVSKENRFMCLVLERLVGSTSLSTSTTTT